MVSSTTPRFGPRCPPVCESTLISSSRTSCASCGRLSSGSAFTSSGERMPSSKRGGAIVSVGISEETNVVIFRFSFGFRLHRDGRGGSFKFFYNRFSGAVTGDDFDPLLGRGKPLLAHLDQLHSFLIPHDQFFEREVAGLHLVDDLFEPLHGLFEVRFG